MGMSIKEYKQLISQDNSEPKNLKRQLIGKANRSLGKEFEDQIEIINQIYKINNFAIIEKTPEPMKVLKHIDRARFEAVFTKSAQPDFKGVIKGGKTVVFDAKFTEADRIRYQVLSDFQREMLVDYNEMGAKSFVLVGFANGGIYNIPITDWINMKEIYGRKYILQEELEEAGYRATKAKNGMIDFLKIIK